MGSRPAQTSPPAECCIVMCCGCPWRRESAGLPGFGDSNVGARWTTQTSPVQLCGTTLSGKGVCIPYHRPQARVGSGLIEKHRVWVN